MRRTICKTPTPRPIKKTVLAQVFQLNQRLLRSSKERRLCSIQIVHIKQPGIKFQISELYFPSQWLQQNHNPATEPSKTHCIPKEGYRTMKKEMIHRYPLQRHMQHRFAKERPLSMRLSKERISFQTPNPPLAIGLHTLSHPTKWCLNSPKPPH